MESRLRELSLAARPFLSAMEARLRELSLAARPFLSAMEVRLGELSLAARPFLSLTTSASSPAASSGAAAAAAAAASIYAFPNPYSRCPSTGRASHLHSCDAELQRKMLQEKERRPFVIENCSVCRGWEVRDAAGERCNDPKYGDRGKLIHRTKEDAQEECDRLVAMGQASREAGTGCRVRPFPCGKHFHVGHY